MNLRGLIHGDSSIRQIIQIIKLFFMADADIEIILLPHIIYILLSCFIDFDLLNLCIFEQALSLMALNSFDCHNGFDKTL